MEVSATFFKSIYDNKTHRRMDFPNFPKFEEFLYKLSERKLGGKNDAELMCPATFTKDTTRANRNVLDWAGWAAVDVDDYEFKGDIKDALRDTIGSFHYVCYSTASSRESLPKFRIVFPTRERIGASNIRAFWYALNSKLESIGDKQTKDLSRMYYTPATYDGAFNFIFTNAGTVLNPADLMEKYPFVEKNTGKTFLDRLPEALQKQIIQHRKDKAQNRDVKWNHYNDCPFWPQRLASEYKVISNTGWYHKMYQIMLATASRAIQKEYPITATEISEMCKAFDAENGNWYQNRPIDKEADRAIEYAYKNM